MLLQSSFQLCQSGLPEIKNGNQKLLLIYQFTSQFSKHLVYPVIYCYNFFITFTPFIFTTWLKLKYVHSTLLFGLFFFTLHKFCIPSFFTQSILLIPQTYFKKFILIALTLDLSYFYHINVSLPWGAVGINIHSYNSLITSILNLFL